MSTIQRTTASGLTDTFSVSFPYISQEHVVVKIDSVEKALGVDYTFPTASSIQFVSMPTEGQIVERRRLTPATQETVFTPGDLDTADLNAANLQALYVAEEASDYAADVVGSVAELAAELANVSALAEQASEAVSEVQGLKEDVDAAVVLAQQAVEDAEAAAGSVQPVAAQIVGAGTATLADGDLVGVVDVSSSNTLFKSTWTSIKAFLKTYFDTVYHMVGGTDIPVADGGSGRGTAVAYAPIVGGTTSTGAHQSVASVGTAGQVLTSGGAAALPAYSDMVGYNKRIYTSGATWNKPTDPRFTKVIVTVQAGGGGGGGVDSGQATVQGGSGAGGGAAIKTVLAASLASTVTVTVGSGGAGGTAGANNGSSGGSSSFGSHCSATGGTGGAGESANEVGLPGTAGVGSSGDINLRGSNSDAGYLNADARGSYEGGTSALGYPGAASRTTSGNGNAAQANTGAGGGGALSIGAAANRSGGNGGSGHVIVEEFYGA